MEGADELIIDAMPRDQNNGFLSLKKETITLKKASNFVIISVAGEVSSFFGASISVPRPPFSSMLLASVAESVRTRFGQAPNACRIM
jgi:hypothetical protein